MSPSAAFAASARFLAKCIACMLVGLFVYLAWWAIWYRMPPTPPRFVDLRENTHQSPYYVSFCASLADNPHGFPGHCYVVWRTRLDESFLTARSAAYMPARYEDQLPSLWQFVPGMICHDAARGNMRNLDQVVAVVSKEQYQRSLDACQSWDDLRFRAGQRDCVAFTDMVANSLHLHVLEHGGLFPQDYIRGLKQMN